MLVVWKCKPGNVEGKENEEELHWKVLTVLSTGGEIDCLAYEQGTLVRVRVAVWNLQIMDNNLFPLFYIIIIIIHLPLHALP